MFKEEFARLEKKRLHTDDLSTRMIVPNPTNRKMHFEPFIHDEV